MKQRGGFGKRGFTSKIDHLRARAFHCIGSFQILHSARENDLVGKVIRKPANQGYVVFHRPIPPEQSLSSTCLENHVGMIDPVGESSANGREFVDLHLVDHSRSDRRAASILRHFQRQNDGVLGILNFNGVSGKKGVSFIQIREGDYRIPVNPVSERINLLIDMQHHNEVRTITSEAPEQSSLAKGGFSEWYDLVYAWVMQSHRLPRPVGTHDELGGGMTQLQAANRRRIKQSIAKACSTENQNQARPAWQRFWLRRKQPR